MTFAEAKRWICRLGRRARVQQLAVSHDRRLEPTGRVVGEAEHTQEGANPRFVVTSLERHHITYDAHPPL